MAGKMLVVEQKAEILPILEQLIKAKEEHLLECFGLMLKHYSKFRSTSTQFPLSPIDESSVLQAQAGENVGQFVVLNEMGGTRRMFLKTRTSRNMFKTSLEDLRRLVTRQATDLQESIAIVVEMRTVANSLGVVFAPYEGITDTVRVMHRYCKLLNDMLEQKFPKEEQKFPKEEQKFPNAEQKFPKAEQKFPVAEQKFPKAGQKFPKAEQKFPKVQQEKADAASQAEEQAAGGATGEAAAGEQSAAAATDQMYVLTI